MLLFPGMVFKYKRWYILYMTIFGVYSFYIFCFICISSVLTTPAFAQKTTSSNLTNTFSEQYLGVVNAKQEIKSTKLQSNIIKAFTSGPNATLLRINKSLNLSPYNALAITIVNTSNKSIIVDVKLTSMNAKDGSSTSTTSFNIPVSKQPQYLLAWFSPQEHANCLKDFGAINCPLGKQQVPAIDQLGGIDPTTFIEASVIPRDSADEAVLNVSTMTAININYNAKLMPPMIDEYGQNIFVEIPNKVHFDNELSSRVEEKLLLPKKVERTIYGGDVSANNYPTSGKFQTVKIDGKWWLIDPAGSLFYITGINVNNPFGSFESSIVTDRENIFKNYQNFSKKVRYSERILNNNKTFGFLYSNIFKKYPINTIPEWRTINLKRLQAWDFNSISSLSPVMFGKNVIPTIMNVNLTQASPLAADAIKNDDGTKVFLNFLNSRINNSVNVRKTVYGRWMKDNPWFIGIYSDQKMWWGSYINNHPTPSKTYEVILAILKQDNTSEIKQKFIEQLRLKYRTYAAFNDVWHINAKNWNEALQLSISLTQEPSDVMTKDLSYLLAFLADAYFSTMKSIATTSFSNILYFGTTLDIGKVSTPPEVIAACIKYCDVLSVSYNKDVFDKDDLKVLIDSGKPIFISNFDIDTRDQNSFQKKSVQFIQDIVQVDSIIGYQWSRFYDPPLTGTFMGENDMSGLLTITDQPKAELITSVQPINTQVYQLRGSKPNRINMPPSLVLVFPAATNVYKTPGTIHVQANTVDNDGTISKVEFYLNNKLMRTDTQAPYEEIFTHLKEEGRYVITVISVDNEGLTATASQSIEIVKPANILPTVSLSSNSESIVEGDVLQLTTNAADSDGTIQQVEFYQDNVRIGQLTTTPFTLLLASLTKGQYTFYSKAYDEVNASVQSNTVTIHVAAKEIPKPDSVPEPTGEPSPDPTSDPALPAGGQPRADNVLPSVTLTSPATLQQFDQQGTVTITADASDVDGAVQSVEFYVGATRIGTSRKAPFLFQWNNVPAGTHLLRAKAIDNVGGQTFSSPIAIAVTSPSIQATTQDNALPITITNNPTGGLLIQWNNIPALSITTSITRSPWMGSTNKKVETFSVTNGQSYFLDTKVVPGEIHKYIIYQYITTPQGRFTRFNMFIAGTQIPLMEDRGGVLIVVDETVYPALTEELKQYVKDLQQEGWQPIIKTTPRMKIARDDVDPANYAARAKEIAAVKSLVTDFYNADKTRNTMLVLVGHVPIPYSGKINPDGHSDHQGAWAADIYYGDMKSNWTDTFVNISLSAALRNVPGDGKFDNPGSVAQVGVGRIDMWGMPADEVMMLKNYFKRNHAYRNNLLGPINQEVIVDDHFGYFNGESFASAGWRFGSNAFGSLATSAKDWFTYLKDHPVVLAYGCGGGGYMGADGIGSTNDFMSKPSKAIFNLLFGSYFGDWDTGSSFLRSPLASLNPESLSLVTAWGNRNVWNVSALILGQPISKALVNPQYPETVYNQIHILGDPTLLMTYHDAPKNVTVVKNAQTIHLNWDPSNDGEIGYHVYRAYSPEGPWTRVTGEANAPIAQTAYDDTVVDATQPVYYRVHAIYHEAHPVGDYYNRSIPATVQTLQAL